ncbi:MAG: hypothetical protein LBP64_00350 [Tannerella sp.]|jgi:hypothetical protein|nr:hypothetical protein [Tannerella sp.]
MKKIFASIFLAGVVPALACADVAAAGQLRADEASPDSAVVYSPSGEKTAKHVYLPGNDCGKYAWENGAWKFSDSEPDTLLFSRAKYDRDVFNALPSKVRYEKVDGWLWFYYPGLALADGGRGFDEELEFKPGYDANGNLTSFEVRFDDSWLKYTVAYNAANNPVSIEMRDPDGDFIFKARYEYNRLGHPTRYESYDWDYDTEAWADNTKETAEYDAQGKWIKYFSSGHGVEYSRSYEYYDGTHFSAISNAYFYSENDGVTHKRREEWKYGADGKPEAYYYYYNGELQEYAVFYPNSLSSSGGGVTEPESIR